MEDQLLTALWCVAAGFFDIDWSVYSSVLEALANLGFSGLSISVNLLIKAGLYQSLKLDVTHESWLARFSHPLLPTVTAVSVSPYLTRQKAKIHKSACDRATHYSSQNMDSMQTGPKPEVLHNRIAEGKVDLVAQYLEFCALGPFPYKAVETLQEISFNAPPSVHEVHQNRLAQAINKLIESPRGEEVLSTVVNLGLFEAYRELMWGACLLWLTSHHARITIKATLSAYADTLSKDSIIDSESASLLLRLHQIIERLDSLHPNIEPAPSTADIEEIEDEDPGGSLHVDEG
ncbi:hypothetical protein MVEN_01863700 [Mycena venus]|uniref:Uncharacterized protein n=1 Tax=Mycena venus TaxID=2733690 RepID=A0A8H7CMA9_9AGAR|nr:hypothetical protein MVEN_01863700 [Mycena venus]